MNSELTFSSDDFHMAVTLAVLDGEAMHQLTTPKSFLDETTEIIFQLDLNGKLKRLTTSVELGVKIPSTDAGWLKPFLVSVTFVPSTFN